MRKNVTKQERTIVEEFVTYVANDGTIFRSEEECRKYEETSTCAINAMFKGVSKTWVDGETFLDGATFYPCCESKVMAIYLRTLDDIEATNKWLLAIYGNHGEDVSLFTSAELGTVQLIETEAFENYFYALGTAESLKKRYCDYIDSMVAKAKGETEKEEK